ncbi:hypothetical protein CBM2595_A80043 [Cupriavidus taiwanensis]|nr:hypothetical protein CBM2595_A80043 [Cupriavidus taiwanensis]
MPRLLSNRTGRAAMLRDAIIVASHHAMDIPPPHDMRRRPLAGIAAAWLRGQFKNAAATYG